MKKLLTLSAFAMFAVLFSTIWTTAAAQNYQKLGTKKVDYAKNKDVITVGLRSGIFTKLKFEVSDGDLPLEKIIVTFGNGTKQEIPVRHNFGRGNSTKEIDLAGNRRIIKSITYVYDNKKAKNKKGVITAYGR
ncbi:MAG: DUF2541 family protein [Cyclobacteriaceae bacterium]|nr:DUF2541 family protein [Cyclobacteriaceae bacterium]